MTSELAEIKYQIETGAIHDARKALRDLTIADPLNLEAWELLAGITDNLDEKAHCYRQILQIDPGQRQAASKLLEISSKIQEFAPSEDSPPQFDPILYCQVCGGPAEVHFVGNLRHRRAICSYCGSEVDLPDSYLRIQRLREQQQPQDLSGSVVQGTHKPSPGASHPENDEINSYPPELQKIIQILKEKGPEAFDRERLRALLESSASPASSPGTQDLEIPQNAKGAPSSQNAPGEEITPTPEDTQSTSLPQGESLDDSVQSKAAEALDNLKQMLKFPRFRQKDARLTRSSLSIEELVLLSGEPLPPEERRDCPNPRCGAVVSKSAKECPWCGQAL